jgi:hypothetical protein
MPHQGLFQPCVDFFAPLPDKRHRAVGVRIPPSSFRLIWDETRVTHGFTVGTVKMTTAMASSPLRQLLEDRVSQLLADADRVVGESRQRAVRDCADRLNQAVRRIRQADSVAGLGAALVDSAAAFASGAALFEIAGRGARLQKVCGVAEEGIPGTFEIPLALAPALAGAIETRDPVAAAAVPGEVSSAVVDLLGHAPDLRVFLVPIVVKDSVPGILYAWGNVEESALELLAQSAAAAWTSLVAPQPASVPALVNIGVGVSSERGGAAAEPARQPASWEALSPDEQQMHLRAQRFARVQVARMQLSQADAVQSGRTRCDLYAGLREAMDAARFEFRERFFAPCPGMLDYLHLEMVRTLAHDDAELLGPDYPGPMV